MQNLNKQVNMMVVVWCTQTAWRVLPVRLLGAQVDEPCLEECRGDSVLGLGFQGHSFQEHCRVEQTNEKCG